LSARALEVKLLIRKRVEKQMVEINEGAEQLNYGSLFVGSYLKSNIEYILGLNLTAYFGLEFCGKH
jgi:hypothetical protein